MQILVIVLGNSVSNWRDFIQTKLLLGICDKPYGKCYLWNVEMPMFHHCGIASPLCHRFLRFSLS